MTRVLTTIQFTFGIRWIDFIWQGNNQFMKKIQIEAVFKNVKVLIKNGEISKAKTQYELILNAFPSNRRPQQGLANLTKLVPSNNQAHLQRKALLKAQLNQLELLQKRGKMNHVFDYAQNLVREHPEEVLAWNFLGSSSLLLGRFDHAITAFKQVTQLNPNFTGGFNNLGVALLQKGKLDEAIDAHKISLSLTPENPDAYYNLGLALYKAGKLDDAIEAYNTAFSLKPEDINISLTLGAIFKAQGNKKKAINAFKNVLSVDPSHTGAHRSLSTLVRYKEADPHIGQVKRLLNRSGITDEDKFQLHFTLAKMQEDTGALKEAVHHYKTGGAIRQKMVAYNFKQDQDLFYLIKKAAPDIKNNALTPQYRKVAAGPIFILGMPRSGTTLVEQILSSHSKISGAGELRFLKQFGGAINTGVEKASTENLIQVRQSYLAELAKFSKGLPFVTDKMPHNFRLIGLICSALPEAKIIHVKRDPAATCWSNFKTFFSSSGLGYSYNLQTVTQYYRLYLDLMAYWEKIYGNRIYALDYDQLTNNQVQETRKLVNHLDLEWEDACLSPHANKNEVRTASHQQVRQKIYKGSSQKWRNFEPFLDGAFDLLSEES
ncbi:hypothetical protein C0081_16695 [Cohaesibacter celericrescens]|uniref:Uncharacterized protein n=1 Tax=Cohaesibacter celericrescens TaxID=2067669 RepID=A0A2N5XNH6_9HYPH|nr:hypothetical protein C0081_16695 [Cohaesibacter celericrescens]